MNRYAQNGNLILTGLLILLFMVPIGIFAPPPQTAHAQGTPVYDALNFAQNSLTAAATGAIKVAEFILAKLADFLVLKEFTLDGLAWIAVDVIIKKVTQDIVTWINNGFEGSPAFLTDPGAFFVDVADATFGTFIDRDPFWGFLCDPFAAQIRASISINYRSTDKEISCRVSDIVGNVENFIGGVSGSFSDGGWRGWFQVVTNDNAYNRYVQASLTLDAHIANRIGVKDAELDWGRGWLSWKECKGAASDSLGSIGAIQDIEQECETVTPGNVIENQLNETLQLGNRRLAVADEINEIIGALLNQLISQALGGSGGLRGFSRGYYPGGQNYFDRYAEEDLATDLFQGRGAYPTNPATARDYEEQFRSNLVDLVVVVEDTELLAQELHACNATSGTTWLNRITPIKDPLLLELATTTINLAVLDEYDKRVAEAETSEELQTLFDQFQNFASGGRFHTLEDVAESDFQRQSEISSTIAGRMLSFQTQIQNALAQCDRNRSINTNDPNFPGGAGP